MVERRLPVRRLTTGMRRLLFVASGLVGLAAFQLFVLTDHTDAYFSWTIAPGATAAFLGAGYLASVPFEFLSAGRRAWVEARHTIPPVLAFTLLTEVATLLHLDKFHFGEPPIWAGLAAWIWIGIYTLVPLTMLVLVPGQLRAAGEDPARTSPMPRSARIALGVQAAILVPPGVLLFVDPERWASIWPWELTPLTGRATAAWLLGVAIGLVAVIAERDLDRVRPGLIAYALFGTFQLVAIARYAGDVRWGDPQAWVFLVVVASMVAIGGLGVARSRAARRAETSAA